MIDLNHILFFLAVVSPLAVLSRAWRPGARYRGWRVAAIIVLFVALASWLFVRAHAGFIAGGAWLALLFLPAIGLRRVADLTMRHRYRSARKLASTLRVLHPSDELRHQVEWLRSLETNPGLAAERNWGPEPDQQQHWRKSYAVMFFILANIAVFLFEMAHQHWQDWNGLHRLGALEPYAVVVNHQYWRLFTALFLHYDVVHLSFNLFALYVLGPPLERAIGSFRFCLCYLIAGIGSNMGVIWLVLHGIAHADQLVGASGCVMGIVGAWGAFLFRNQHIPMARQRLKNVIMIVVIQVAFDFSTPQVSMAAHLCGLVAGFLIGLALAPREETSPVAS